MSELKPDDSEDATIFTLHSGEFRAWIEQETVHIKAVDKFGDPLELAEHEVREVIKALGRLLDTIEKSASASADCPTEQS